MIALAAFQATGSALVAASSSLLAAADGTSQRSWLSAASSSPMNSGIPDLGLGQYALNLVGVVVVLGLLAYVAARLGKGRLALPAGLGLRARDLRIEDRLPVDPQRSIVVVSHGKRRFLVGMTNYSINTLAELDPAPDFEHSLQQEVRG